ncbi:TIGR03943 family protein [Boudabousia liubingyangii]|uniref:TIGR03943 family protein n=1 Tax=Boudabousia liubingyangii TaxID=1921764 RepID=A0A1Q5PLL2_9ACTO|nr:TIGR03943 family protein [Boudabousia liubingyangii]OKL47907.1 TIGR03943 family protein [Boudabousia liubingyangii]
MPQQSRSEGFAGATVVATGMTLTYLSLTGKINKYLLPSFRPWILLCGVILLGFGIWTLGVWRAANAAEKRSQKNHEGHYHPYSKAAFLMLVPVLIVGLSLPAPLGAFMVSKVATGQSRAALNKPKPTALIPGQTVPGDIPKYEDQVDFAAAANEAPRYLPFPELANDHENEMGLDELTDRVTGGDPKQITGKRIKTLGFVSALEPQMAEKYHGWMIARYKIYCCAADGVVYSAVIPNHPMPAENTWVELTGTVDQDASVDGIPVLVVTDVKTVPEPEEPYL